MEKITKGLFRITGYIADLGGCGHIRVIIPFTLLNQLQVKNFQFQAFFNNIFTKDLSYYKNSTIIQFQRAATSRQLEFFELARRKIKLLTRSALVYEIDDSLFNIPEHNFALDYYKPLFPYMKEMLSKADVVMVSTQYLKEVYSVYNNKIHIIPNHLPRYTWGETSFNEYERKKPVILYPCSSNHFSCKRDIKGGDIGDELMNYIRKTTDKWEWTFVGGLPHELEDLVKSGKIKRHSWFGVFEYPRFLKTLKADIGIAPLELIDFNRSKCLVGNTRIVSNYGITTIDKISKLAKIWQEYKMVQVSEIISYNDIKTIKIVTKKGYEIEGSQQHKIRSNSIYKELQYLNIGDSVDLSFFSFPNVDYQKAPLPFFLTKKIDSIDMSLINNIMLPSVTINERWGRMFGYIIGDGHIANSNSVGISCNTDYSDIIDDIELFGLEIGVKTFRLPKFVKGKSNNIKGVDIVFSSRNFKWMLENLGFKGVYGKILRVPEIILRSPKPVIREFIRGLFEADGTVRETGCSFSSKNIELVKDIQFLLLGFGIISVIYNRLNKKYNRYYATLVLNRQASDIFHKEIGFISERKSKKMENIIIKSHSNAYKEWELKDNIVSISNGMSDVYDVQIPENNYYMANGIISHNSNIKALEYTALGIPGVYTKIEPYSNMALQAENDESFISHLESLLDINKRHEVWTKDFDIVKDQLFWEDNNFSNLRAYVRTYLNAIGKDAEI